MVWTSRSAAVPGPSRHGQIAARHSWVARASSPSMSACFVTPRRESVTRDTPAAAATRSSVNACRPCWLSPSAAAASTVSSSRGVATSCEVRSSRGPIARMRFIARELTPGHHHMDARDARSVRRRRCPRRRRGRNGRRWRGRRAARRADHPGAPAADRRAHGSRTPPSGCRSGHRCGRRAGLLGSRGGAPRTPCSSASVRSSCRCPRPTGGSSRATGSSRRRQAGEVHDDLPRRASKDPRTTRFQRSGPRCGP